MYLASGGKYHTHRAGFNPVKIVGGGGGGGHKRTLQFLKKIKIKKYCSRHGFTSQIASETILEDQTYPRGMPPSQHI